MQKSHLGKWPKHTVLPRTSKMIGIVSLRQSDKHRPQLCWIGCSWDLKPWISWGFGFVCFFFNPLEWHMSPHVHTRYKYWVGQMVHFCFSITSYGKTQTDSAANPTEPIIGQPNRTNHWANGLRPCFSECLWWWTRFSVSIFCEIQNHIILCHRDAKFL